MRVIAKRFSASLLVMLFGLGVFETTTARGAIVESNTALFAWDPATGPVAYYGVWVTWNGEQPGDAPDHFTDTTRISVWASYGNTVVIQVAAFDADGNQGPRSEASETVWFMAPTPPPTIIEVSVDFGLAAALTELGDVSGQLVLQLIGDQKQFVDVGASGDMSPFFGFDQLVVGTPDQATTVRLLDANNLGLEASGAQIFLFGLGRGALCAREGGPGLVIHEGSTLVLGGVDVYASDGTTCVHINSLFPGDAEDPNVIPYDRGWLQLYGDLDDDGFLDPLDNCASVWNPEQEDADSDGIGDACECGYDPGSGEPLLAGDATGDGIVDLTDYRVWVNHLYQSGVGFENGDFDCDGFVDIADYLLWANNLGARNKPM